MGKGAEDVEDLTAPDPAPVRSQKGFQRSALVGIEPIQIDRLDTRLA